ncbi:hypothetical protein [Marinobacter subterrani]|uniref:Uncharacterized protein n=1 Tax=Marinobacter subterrani TaxID=1658765 RepID=A0A0J7JC79_9GAMM|nr:hypothetical protein [Marinobacter subterrani]KMQ75426.1 hypothetical protein Msub_11630 [Marinobacter subterrani]
MSVSFGTGRRLARGAILASVLMAGHALALAPEHETRRLMLATQEAVEAQKWGEAAEYLNRLQQLKGDKPVDYYFYRGRVMQHSSHLNEAQAALENYVTRAGAEGSHYQESLQLITDIEKAREESALAAPGAGEPERIAVIKPAGDGRVASLRKLYLADSDREALTLHINSLLELAGWRQDQTVVRLDRPADVEYRVSVLGGELQIQEVRRGDDGRVVRSTESIPVFGINPQVEWRCEPAVSTCWVYDPRDGSRLFQLALNREYARDIADTLGLLIRSTQTQ